MEYSKALFLSANYYQNIPVDCLYNSFFLSMKVLSQVVAISIAVKGMFLSLCFILKVRDLLQHLDPSECLIKRCCRNWRLVPNWSLLWQSHILVELLVLQSFCNRELSGSTLSLFVKCEHTSKGHEGTPCPPWRCPWLTLPHSNSSATALSVAVYSQQTHSESIKQQKVR